LSFAICSAFARISFLKGSDFYTSIFLILSIISVSEKLANISEQNYYFILFGSGLSRLGIHQLQMIYYQPAMICRTWNPFLVSCNSAISIILIVANNFGSFFIQQSIKKYAALFTKRLIPKNRKDI
jgi:hypothetical protein